MTYDTIATLLKEVKYGNGAFICIGTSAQVHPAAFLIPFFTQVKNKYIINKEELKVADYDLRTGSATEEMEKLTAELLSPSF
jgi:NAD-dependent SIR2 family protein deacetylase